MASVRLAPEFVEISNPAGRADCLVLCDHAGNRMPSALADLGLPAAELERHIAYDIGAAIVARELAAALDATAILDHCSRLVIDPNRRPGTATSIPEVSDGTVVPGNRGLSRAARIERARRWHLPYHRAIAHRLAAFGARARVPIVIAVHSFTPRMRNGLVRPWQIGVLWRGDRRIASPLLEALHRRGDLVVGDNQPYSGQAEFGYTIEFHCQRTRLPHVMLEIRHDEIAAPDGARAYADIAATALAPILGDRQLYQPWDGAPPAAQPWRRPQPRLG